MASKTKTAVVETTEVETPAETPKTKEPRFAALAGERLEWVAANARPAVSSCLCGCGGDTKGRFVPGHDATLKEHLVTTAKGDNEEDAATAVATLEVFGWEGQLSR